MSAPIICGSCGSSRDKHPVPVWMEGDGDWMEPSIAYHCEGKDWFIKVAVGEGVTVETEKAWWCVLVRGFTNCVGHPDRRFLFPDRSVDDHAGCDYATVVRERKLP